MDSHKQAADDHLPAELRFDYRKARPNRFARQIATFPPKRGHVISPARKPPDDVPPEALPADAE
jgi:hypothetical protein